MDEFSWNLTLEAFIKICVKKFQIRLQLGKKYQALYMKT